MTDFNGVKRRTRGSYSTLYRQPRQIVASLEQGDLISFRESGRRAKFVLPADAAFCYAIHLAAMQSAREKKLRKAAQ
jgi:hypothetical protein